MRNHPPDLDMTLEGRFTTPPKPPFATRVMLWAIVIALIAGGLSLAAFALWIAFIILPVALAAGVIAWLAFRYQVWRAQSRVSRQRAERRDVGGSSGRAYRSTPPRPSHDATGPASTAVFFRTRRASPSGMNSP